MIFDFTHSSPRGFYLWCFNQRLKMLKWCHYY